MPGAAAIGASDGPIVRRGTAEVALLQEAITEQRSLIDDREGALDEREATNAGLRAELERRTAERVGLRGNGGATEVGFRGSQQTSPAVPWRHVKRWLAERVDDRGPIGGQQTGE